MTIKKPDKLTMILITLEAMSGVAGSALILTENHPYLSIGILAIGAAASKVLLYVKTHSNESTTTKVP